MTPLHLPRLVHRGHVEAVALLIRDESAALRQQHALRTMQPGDRIFALTRTDHAGLSDALLVQFAAPRRIDVSELCGVALTQQSTLLASFPLSKTLLAEGLEARAQLVFAVEGSPVFARLAEPIDPSRWLDVSAFRLLKMRSLGAAPKPVQAAIQVRSARAVLGRAELSEEGVAASKALRSAGTATLQPSPLLHATVRVLAVAMHLFGGLLGGLSGGDGGAPKANTQGAKKVSQERRLPSDARPYEPPWLLRKLAAWVDALRMRAWRSSLGNYLARKHAEYLARLLEALDTGDLDAALRHAIPLSQGADGAPKAPSLSLPSPRTDFSLGKARASGGSLGVGDSIYAMLKARYRALYDKLIERGRIDEAAFVLAELLDDALGAVALLEKHGRVREAAELAEARKLEPAIQVRQWIVAKDIPRALLLARRHGAFEAAITHLRNEPETRKILAIAWAGMRADAGDFLGALLALEMGQALHASVPLALAWAEHAQEAGGVNGAVALLWRTRLMGSIDQETERRARALLLTSGPDQLPLRAAFISALAQRSEPFLAPLARLALRAGTRDRALFDQPPAATLEKLEVLGGGGALREDRPTIAAPRASLSTGTRTLSMGPRGALAIRDAVRLPNGNWLVALGEAGIRILRSDGSTLVAFEAPASALVLSDSGARALALASRGDLTLVHRIDTLTRRIGDAFELARLSSHADSFDGERWSVVLDGQGHVLDLLQDKPRSLFRIDDATRVERALGWISFEVRSGNVLERLRYDEHNITLRVRQALPERFDKRFQPHPFEATHEPLCAHLKHDHVGLHLAIGVAPHPTTHTFPFWTLRTAKLSVGKAHAAFNASEGIEARAFGPYTLLRALRIDGLRETHLAFRGAQPPAFVIESIPADPNERSSKDADRLAQLRGVVHPNLVRIHEVGRVDDKHFLASEYVAGRSLDALLRLLLARKTQLPPALAVGIALQLLEGLHALHTIDVHREVRPSACMVGFDGHVRLRVGRLHVPPEAQRSRPGIHYLTPEQVMGRVPDARTDLFAIGTLLYEALAGRRLFRGESDIDSLQRIRDANVPPLTSESHLSLELQAIVHKALAREPSDRWPSAQAMRDALRALFPEEATSADALAAWLKLRLADEVRTEADAMRALANPTAPGIRVIHTVTFDIEARIACSAQTRHRVLTEASSETLVCFDDEGRLLAVDLATGRELAGAALH